jgi:uncharacterized membrane protein
MKNLTTIGRFLFALAILAFAIQHFIYAGSGNGLGPPWTTENHLLACGMGIVLLAAAAGMATGKQLQGAAVIVGAVSFARGVIFDFPKIMTSPHNPGPWTSGFELFAIAAASFILATLTMSTADANRAGSPRGMLFQSGRVLFAAALVVFGIQHLLYGHFVATLIPDWIPARVFWAYFIGVDFIAAALAIVSGMVARLAGTLLGTMFLLWVLILHAPRVVRALHNGNEWTSMFVALAMSGAAFIVAAAFARD